ncbi:MAG: DUF4465 domain-containing protein [Planctomycetaceae bacterium]
MAVLAWLLVACCGSPAPADVVTFEDVVLPGSGYLNGDPGGLQPGDSVSVPLVSGSVSFSNTNGIDLTYEFPYWFGFSFSKVVNTTDGVYTNQYASYPGGGYESSQYAVAYADYATITLPGAATVAGFRIANTTYARSTMVSADPELFASPLQPPKGYFSVTATGLLGSGTTGTAEFFLADFRGASPPGVLGGWSWFPLGDLGTVDAVSFTFAGSDVGDYGLNTAAYFAMDDFTYTPVPEPAAAALALVGGAWWVGGRIRRRVGRVGPSSSAFESPP